MLRSLLTAVLLGVLLPVTMAAGVAPSASASASAKPVCFWACPISQDNNNFVFKFGNTTKTADYECNYVKSSKKTESINCFYSPITGRLDKVVSDMSCTFDPAPLGCCGVGCNKGDTTGKFFQQITPARKSRRQREKIRALQYRPQRHD
ncbi:hypothetical protein EHS25_007052 [Saitozyma podzolica]|uniref:Uncharacterized protein n=1 Tax=Saitozyma podzolica TaxID=1890683 RepID=A0A427XPF2_9TREE|nr:hypothetical protein EHS25_007052 [Saitozyma podzolica]